MLFGEIDGNPSNVIPDFVRHVVKLQRCLLSSSQNPIDLQRECTRETECKRKAGWTSINLFQYWGWIIRFPVVGATCSRSTTYARFCALRKCKFLRNSRKSLIVAGLGAHRAGARSDRCAGREIRRVAQLLYHELGLQPSRKWRTCLRAPIRCGRPIRSLHGSRPTPCGAAGHRRSDKPCRPCL